MSKTREDQDFSAAMHEIESNIEVRRLMFVISNVLVPALAMAMTDCLTGSAYPAHLAWFPEHIIAIVGSVLALSGLLVGTVLIRCHFGVVVNAAKMRKVRMGSLKPQGLNWLGVTTNFVVLAGLSAGGGAMLAVASFGWGFAAWIVGPALVALLLFALRVNHWRANRLAVRLEGSWQHGAVSHGLLEEHSRKSLDATTADVAVIVTMAAALFAGLFNAMTNVGGINSSLALDLPVIDVKAWGIGILSGFALLSLLLSGRMVVRLRLALAWHATTLARLRDEQDNAWQFRLLERTFLLFALVQVLSATSALILFWSLWGVVVGSVAAGLILVAGFFWYPIQLWRGARLWMAEASAPVVASHQHEETRDAESETSEASDGQSAGDSGGSLAGK